MTRDGPAELRAKARHYRERAAREIDPAIVEAFHELATTLEQRAAVMEAAVLEGPLEDDQPIGS